MNLITKSHFRTIALRYLRGIIFFMTLAVINYSFSANPKRGEVLRTLDPIRYWHVNHDMCVGLIILYLMIVPGFYAAQLYFNRD